MLTFLEFYRAMVKFVNFRLYSELGLAYPPKPLGWRLETCEAARVLPLVHELLSSASSTNTCHVDRPFPRRDAKLDKLGADVASLEVEMREAGKAQQQQSEQAEKARPAPKVEVVDRLSLKHDVLMAFPSFFIVVPSFSIVSSCFFKAFGPSEAVSKGLRARRPRAFCRRMRRWRRA